MSYVKTTEYENNHLDVIEYLFCYICIRAGTAIYPKTFNEYEVGTSGLLL